MDPLQEPRLFRPLPCHIDQIAASPSADISPEQLYDALKNNFFMPVPFDLSKEAVDEAMASFFTFLRLDDKLKQTLNGKIAAHHRRGELGLVSRNPADGAYSDKKEFFHYHPLLLDKHAALIAVHPSMKAFMDNANAIWHKGAAAVRQMLDKLENYFPGIYKGIFDADHTPHLTLRFLRYEWDKTQHNLAKAHWDVGVCTLAIAESSPGLRIGSCEDNLKEVVHKPNHALFFLSKNFEALTNSTQLLPAWHDVVLTEELAARADAAYTRWALVLFVEGHSLTAPSRTETHNIPLDPR